MPVEVSLVSQDGVPEDALLSMRAGSVRRQAAINSGKAFRFPKIGIDESPVKIDIMQTIGTAYLVVKPGEERYQAIFQGKADMACEFDFLEVDGSAPQEEVKPEPVGDDAKNYLDQHGILSFVQAVLQTVIKERPADPYAHIARHFLCGYNPTDGRSPAARRTGHMTMSMPTAMTLPPKVEVTPPVAEPAPQPAKKAEAAPAEEPAADAVAAAIAAEAGDPEEVTEDDENLMSLRAKMRSTLEDAESDGRLAETLRKAGEPDDAPPDSLRDKMRETLESAQSDGRLMESLKKIGSQYCTEGQS